MTRFFLLLFAAAILSACNSNDKTIIKSQVPVSTIDPVMTCDTFPVDKPEIRNAKKVLSVWLETASLDWFLDKRQMAWREAIAWSKQVFPVDSNPIIKCLCNEKKNIFLYIPNHFYQKEKNGNLYFQFFIVNNSADTILIPRIDATVDNISSAVSCINSNDTSRQWLLFQQTSKMVECGNSFWTMKLPPKTAIKTQIDSEYLNLGDTTFDYRLELTLGNQKITSNSVKINLMKKQVPFLGKPFN